MGSFAVGRCSAPLLVLVVDVLGASAFLGEELGASTFLGGEEGFE